MVSPDGQTVALAILPLPHTGERVQSTIRLIDLESGKTRALVDDPAVSPLGFSSEGGSLAYSRSRGPEPNFNPNGVFLKPVHGGETIDVTAQIDRALRGMAWLPGGQSILVSGVDLTAQALWYQPLDGAPQRLDLGGIHPGSPVVAPNGTVVFVGREDNRASELYAMRAGQWEPRRLTSFNDALAEMNLGRVETVIWDGPDGYEQNGVLVYPPDYQEGGQYPLVLSIHGGPMGASGEAFNTFNQIMAARGWLVFSPNYRGSSTQGKAFQGAVINDAGDGPGRDVMSGVQVLKDRGIVDERRVAVSGWSYGGYMTAWLTAHYDGWAAAMAGAAVTDWFDWYNMADMNVWAGYGLAGSPWLNDNAMNYWRQSPMAYAHQIRTPTLILSDTGDERVTVSQSYKLYHALKDNGVEVKFVVYPVPGHFPGDPVHQRDLRRRWVEWIAQHFEPDAAQDSSGPP
jgi:dipeptidyl aminopeptidase/acylaminoacyl peptidase